MMKKNSPEKMVLATVEAETLIQRIARNVAWYALRIARPGYLKAHSSAPLTFVSIADTDKAREWVHWLELQQSKNGDKSQDDKPVPLHYVIFRG
ncbi:hypothetical protein ACSFCX_10240 [Yokenella regensburgei]|uniref:hypothetical protein n=1 Tax=Yokenella regensburgei TaxID=158877 RepID=UPI003ED9CC7F